MEISQWSDRALCSRAKRRSRWIYLVDLVDAHDLPRMVLLRVLRWCDEGVLQDATGHARRCVGMCKTSSKEMATDCLFSLLTLGTPKTARALLEQPKTEILPQAVGVCHMAQS